MSNVIDYVIYFFVIVSVLFSTIIFFFYSNFNDLFFENHYPLKLNESGDFLGGYLGAVLSLITVVLIFRTYLSQKKELQEQREGFELTRVYDLLYREFQVLYNLSYNHEKDNSFINQKITLDFRLSEFKKTSILSGGALSNIYEQLTQKQLPFVKQIDSTYKTINHLIKSVDDVIEKDKMKELVKIKKHEFMINLFEAIIIMQDYLETNKNKIEKYNQQEVNELKSSIEYVIKQPQH